MKPILTRIALLIIIQSAITSINVIVTSEISLAQQKERLFFDAIERGDQMAIAEGIKEGVNVNMQDESNSSPLHYALQIKNFDSAENIARMLIQAGAQLDPINIFGNTAFHQSRHRQLEPELKELYEQTKRIGSQLSSAAQRKNIPILTRLLKAHPFSVNARNKQGITPLHAAAFTGANEAINLLLEHNANPLVQTESGEIPLHYSARKGHLQSTKKLLEKNPSQQVMAIEELQNTPLHYAVKNKNPDVALAIAKQLIQYGADLYQPNALGFTPLNLLAQAHASSAAQILENMADDIFFDAIKKGNIDKVKSLVNQGYTRVFKAKQNNKTALELSKQAENKALIELLEELETDPITVDNLTAIKPDNLISFNNRLWTKKSLFYSSLSAITPKDKELVSPFTRQPLPSVTITNLKDHFNISDREYRDLIDIKKESERLTNVLNIASLKAQERKQYEERLKELTQKLNTYLERKKIIEVDNS